MLASTLGIPFNPDQSYDEKKQTWKISGKIVRTTHITQPAEGDKKERAVDHCDCGSCTSDSILQLMVPDKGISCAV